MKAKRGRRRPNDLVFLTDAWLFWILLGYTCTFFAIVRSIHSKIHFDASFPSSRLIPSSFGSRPRPESPSFSPPPANPPPPPPPPPHPDNAPRVPAKKSGRKILDGLRGCHRIRADEDCCSSLDGRTDEEFGRQDCVVARATFSSGNNCEPALWVKDGHKHEAAECPNGVDFNRPPNFVKTNSGSRGLPSSALGLSALEMCEKCLGPSGFDKEWQMCSKTDEPPADSKTESQGYCRHNGITGGTYCNFRLLEIDPSKVHASQGGEEIRSVMGRAESAEFPKYTRGAFQLGCSEDSASLMHKQSTQFYPHHLKLVMQSLTFPGPGATVCGSDEANHNTLPGKTMLFTRYEYANLFHQMTDWYNMFVVGEREKILESPLRFIFLDGHPKGALDSAWDVFSRGLGYVRIKSLTERICLDHAIIMPMGYRSPVDIHGMTGPAKRCQGDKYVAKFRETVRNWLQVPKPNDTPVIRVGIIFRRDYLAHPRAGSGRTSRKIQNEQQVVSALSALSTPGDGWKSDFRSLSLESIPFAKQVQEVAILDVLIGAHGAALSYALWMMPDSTLVEITSGGYTGRFHFKYFATWAGLRYHSMTVSGIYLNLQPMIPTYAWYMTGGENLNVDVNRLTDVVRGACAYLATAKAGRELA